jgi:hypothetical protein
MTDLQLPLDFARSRRSDPATSHQAAARVPKFEGAHFKAILTVLHLHGPLTIYGISERACSLRWHLDHVQVARRMGELERAGKVRRSGETRPGPSGSQCAVWCLR